VVTGIRLLPRFRTALSAEELAGRARRVRVVLTDCDGVLTDGSVLYGPEGEALKRFSLKDGMGVERLREAGIATAIVTREHSACARRRAEKLRLPFHFEGVADKVAHLPEIVRQTGHTLEELAFIGDDVNDLAVMEAVASAGLTGAPQDAFPRVRRRAHFRSSLPGGEGAFREFAEWILELRGES
jgi:3-deoxy-D-manno-octulosonate 8-phosphate phosphatase (KDO 8-P phosphatase)